MKVTATQTNSMDRQVRQRADLSNFKGPVLIEDLKGRITDGEMVTARKYIYMEVPPPYYPLQPARQSRGGLHPGRRSPGVDGGAMREEGGGGSGADQGVFQW